MCAFKIGCVAVICLAIAAPGAAQSRQSLSTRLGALEASTQELIEIEQSQALRWAEIERLLTAHQQRLGELDENLAAIQQQSADRDEGAKHAQDRVAGFGQQIASLVTQLAANEKRMAKLTRELKWLRQQVVARDAIAEALRDRIGSLEGEVNSLRASLTANEAMTSRTASQQSTPDTQVTSATFRARRPTHMADIDDEKRERLQAATEKVAAIQRLRADVEEFRRQNEEAVHRTPQRSRGEYYGPGSLNMRRRFGMAEYRLP